jgi:NAD(P)-dependent dehydrogenase (short-subunit alcohol dehydrogenase family)
MTMGSGAAYTDPPAPAGSGGWGLGYAIGKAAGHRLVGHLKVEFAGRGLRAFNVDPGYVSTERNQSVADALDGTNVAAQELCRQRELYPAW